MFRTVPLSILRSFSLYTQQWCMSYRFADSLRAGSGRNHFRPDTARNLSANLYDILQQNQTSSFLILPATCQKICMTYCTRTKPVPSWSCSQPVNKSVWHIAAEPNHFRPDPARKRSANLYDILQQNQTSSVLILLATCQQICMTYCNRTKPLPSWSCSQAVSKPVWDTAAEPNHFLPEPARNLSANLYDILQQNQTSSVLNLLASCQQTCMTYTIAVCTVKNSWWGKEELSETCRVLFQR